MDRSTLPGLSLLLASPSCKHPHRVSCPPVPLLCPPSPFSYTAAQAPAVTMLLPIHVDRDDAPWPLFCAQGPVAGRWGFVLGCKRIVVEGAEAGLQLEGSPCGAADFQPGVIVSTSSLSVLRAGQHSPCIGLYPAPRRACLTLFGSTAYYLTLGTPINS